MPRGSHGARYLRHCSRETKVAACLALYRAFLGWPRELGKACQGRHTLEVWSLLCVAPQGELGSSRTYREASVGRQIYRTPSLLQTCDL